MQARQFGIHSVKSNLTAVPSKAIAHSPSNEAQQILELQTQKERERLVSRITWRIHRSLDLQEILTTTVADVRQFLQTDRVVVFRFEPDWSGVVAVESVSEEWLPILGMTVKDPCFAKLNSVYTQPRYYHAVDNIHDAELASCYVDLLTQFQVQANLMLPIVQGDRLWGLLVAHHCQEPRSWQFWEIELLQDLSTQVAIAIQQSELYHQVQTLNAKLEQQIKDRTQELEQSLDFAAVLKRITERIRDSLDEGQILQTAVRELVSTLKVDYCCAALYNPERTHATIQYEFTHADLDAAVGQVLQVADTPKVHGRLLSGEHFEAYETGRSAYLQTGETGDMACPTLFERFAAKLLYPIYLDPSACEPVGESTASTACEINSGAIGYLAVIDQTYHVFSETEIKLVTQVANQCAIAIRQARLYQASQSQVEALKKLNQLKDDFLSTVSHELRTPVTSMKMAIQMLNLALTHKNTTPPGLTVRYLNILQDQCEREIELINDLLTLQQLESANLPLSPTEIDLQPWLAQLTEALQPRIQSRQQKIVTQVAANLPMLICDASSLKRSLTELLDNACKYSPPESTITLKVWAELETICLSVGNSGVEIPDEELPRIFDKFYRIPSADPWKQGGTGLGLALVQQLVHNLNGSVRVASQAGETCFTICLPLEPHL